MVKISTGVCIPLKQQWYIFVVLEAMDYIWHGQSLKAESLFVTPVVNSILFDSFNWIVRLSLRSIFIAPACCYIHFVVFIMGYKLDQTFTDCTLCSQKFLIFQVYAFCSMFRWCVIFCFDVSWWTIVCFDFLFRCAVMCHFLFRIRAVIQLSAKSSINWILFWVL